MSDQGAGASLDVESGKPLWEGVEVRECGEHRTVGSHRAWCFDCTEWCYSNPAAQMRCRGCELPALRAALAVAEADKREWMDLWKQATNGILTLLGERDVAEARAARAENQARHWAEQEAKQRRLRHEEGVWKHRALEAERRLIDAEARAADCAPIPRASGDGGESDAQTDRSR